MHVASYYSVPGLGWVLIADDHWDERFPDKDYRVTVHVNGDNCAANTVCTSNLTFTIKDQTASGHVYGIVNGCDATVEGYHEYFTSGFASASDPMLTLKLNDIDCSKVSCYYVAMLGTNTMLAEDDNGKLRKLVKDEQKIDSIADGGNNSTNRYTEDKTTNKPVYDATSGTNGGIIFSSGSSSNVASAVMEGSQALYDSVSKFRQQNHADLVGLSNAVSRVGTGLVSGGSGTNGSGTNVYSLSLSNYALASTQSAMSNTLVGISNLFGGGSVSNGNYQVGIGGETNYSAAEFASRNASAELGVVESGLSGFIDGFKIDDMDDHWAAPSMTYTFRWAGGSKTLDFNPMNWQQDGSEQVSVIFSASKALWSWLLAIIYLAKCARDSGKAIEMCEMARGVTVSSPTTKKTYT